uniref:(California timema) hypothetical protein n=1 Tax=Timema californicum TaxID=61474 RepID=A0A7R9IYW8_TIMCA|nr:unnamed protein product [Timema californicum]
MNNHCFATNHKDTDKPVLIDSGTHNQDFQTCYTTKKVLAPLVKTLRQSPDLVEEYRAEYGYLGPALHGGVVKARTQPTPSSTAGSTIPTNTSSAPMTGPLGTRTVSSQPGLVQAGMLRTRTVASQPGLVQADVSLMASQARTLMMGGPPSSRTVSNPGSKYVIVTSRPPTPNQLQSPGVSQSPTVVKFVTSSQPLTTQKMVSATAGGSQMTKLVVVCMANSGTTTGTTLVSQAGHQPGALGMKSVFMSQQPVKMETDVEEQILGQ